MQFAPFLAMAVAAVGPSQVVVRRADIERDLELFARVEGTTPVYTWWPMSVAVEVVDRSTTTSYPIVLPGDGSDVDEREPYVYFTTELRADDGTWKLLQPPGIARCGVYDPYWLDEVVRIGPGESRRLPMTVTPFLPEHGRVRFRAHYAYKARPPGRTWGDLDPTPPPGGMGGMQGVEPFELVSAPIEFTLSAPEHARAVIEGDLALELTGAPSKLSCSWEPLRLHAKLVNRSTNNVHRVLRPSFSPRRFTPEEGLHEPHVRALVSVDRGDGRWVPAGWLSGGFYDGPIDGPQASPRPIDWRSQVVELGPGQSLEFDLPAACALFDLQGASVARVSVAYDYYACPIRGADGKFAAAPESLGAMAGVPPFALHSNELTWPVSSPLEIEIAPRADRDATRASSLADLVSVVLRNRGDEAVEISSADRAAKIEISVSGLTCGGRTFDFHRQLVLRPLVLPPNTAISLLEDPAVDPAPLPAPTQIPGPVRRHVQAEALLHRPGWLYALSATWKAAAK